MLIVLTGFRKAREMAMSSPKSPYPKSATPEEKEEAVNEAVAQLVRSGVTTATIGVIARSASRKLRSGVVYPKDVRALLNSSHTTRITIVTRL